MLVEENAEPRHAHFIEEICGRSYLLIVLIREYTIHTSHHSNGPNLQELSLCKNHHPLARQRWLSPRLHFVQQPTEAKARGGEALPDRR